MRGSLRIVAAGTILAALALIGTMSPPASQTVSAQGYSGSLPNVSPHSGTSLRAVYTAGTVTSGGSSQAITADATGLLTTAAMTDCAAPTYTACNIIYWAGSGGSLSTTTSPLTAFKPNQVVVAFVTTDGSDITAVYPASRAPAVPYVTYTDGFAIVPPSECAFTFTTTAAAAGFPKFLLIATGQVVNEAKTDTTGGTVTYDCALSSALSRSTSGQSVTVTAVDMLYSVVTTTLTSIANPTIKKVTGPTSAGGTGAGTVTDACGSLTYTPSTIQKTAVAAGTYYWLNVSCGTPYAVSGINTTLAFSGSMVTAGSTATIFDVASLVVEYKKANY